MAMSATLRTNRAQVKARLMSDAVTEQLLIRKNDVWMGSKHSESISAQSKRFKGGDG